MVETKFKIYKLGKKKYAFSKLGMFFSNFRDF